MSDGTKIPTAEKVAIDAVEFIGEDEAELREFANEVSPDPPDEVES